MWRQAFLAFCSPDTALLAQNIYTCMCMQSEPLTGLKKSTLLLSSRTPKSGGNSETPKQCQHRQTVTWNRSKHKRNTVQNKGRMWPCEIRKRSQNTDSIISYIENSSIILNSQKEVGMLTTCKSVDFCPVLMWPHALYS